MAYSSLHVECRYVLHTNGKRKKNHCWFFFSSLASLHHHHHHHLFNLKENGKSMLCVCVERAQMTSEQSEHNERTLGRKYASKNNRNNNLNNMINRENDAQCKANAHTLRARTYQEICERCIGRALDTLSVYCVCVCVCPPLLLY